MAGGEGGMAMDQERFDAIYRENVDSVFRYAMSLLSNPTRADDVRAEVFLQAWRKRESFRGSGSVRSWLLSITHNCAISLLRKVGREVVDSEQVDAVEPASADDDAVEGMRVEDGRVQWALRRLTAEQRQVILLRFVAGWSHDWIGERMGRDATAVRSMQYRALRKLRDLMGEQERAA